MNIEGLETREGKVCTKCGVWKPLEEFNKNKNCKDGRRTECRECQKEYQKQWRGNNPKYDKEYRESNKEHIKEYKKQWRENNPEYHNSEQQKQWRENNKEHKKEYDRQYRENNKEHIKEYGKQWYQNNKKNNLQYISSIVEQINPVLKQSNLPIYGYVYMFKNIKTGHVYIGQTIRPLKYRYKGSVVRNWIKERLEYDTQKFKKELIEADIEVTEALDIAFCQYHLDKLEAYYINKYDSYNNGYNNREGNHNTNDGLEEFEEILQQYNIEFIDGEIKEKRLPKQA